jgi:hypothetical protein
METPTRSKEAMEIKSTKPETNPQTIQTGMLFELPQTALKTRLIGGQT